MWWLLLFVSVCHGAPVPDTFTLSVPDGPLSVLMGSSIVLPCSLSPAFTESLQVRWHRPNKYKTPVLLYEKGQIQQQSADPQYKGRVSLTGELEKGDVSLKLENVSRADSGEFVCFVAGNKWYEQASVHLIVKAPPVIGSPLVLSVTDGGGGQVNVTCVSDGWSPQPTLTWRNNRGTEIPSHNHHSAPDAHGLVSVTSWLVHSSSDSEWVACSVGLSEEERKESRILPYISGTDAGPWKEVFFIFLVLFLLLSCITGFVLYRRGLLKCNDSKEGAAESEQDQSQASKGETESLLNKQSEVETLNQKITELQSQLNESNRKVKANNPQTAELQNQLDESKREVETLNKKIKVEEDIRKTLEGKVNAAENIQKENQNLKEPNEGLEKNQSDEVKTLNLKITELQSQLNESKRKEEEKNQQITGLLKKQSEGVETLKRIAELQNQLDESKEEVVALKQTIEESQQTETESLLKKQSEEVKTLNQNITELQRQLSNREVETNNPQIASLLKKQSEEIAELQNQLDGSKGEVDTLKQKIKGLQSQLQENNKQVETKDQQIAWLQSHLNESNRQVETKDQQIAGLQSHLNESNREMEAKNQQIAGASPQNHEPALFTWERLKDFKKSPTLDETSKQGDLRISSGGKRVNILKRDSTTVQPHYVLCKDKFSSGQHYWEVRVADKESWFVGVCSDSLRKLSEKHFTLQNGCWLLCYDKDQGLYINTDPITQGQVTTPLRKLGVFLDCSGHVLTFYDAESQSYLCTFNDVRSAEPLAPVISPGVRDINALVML